MASLVKKSYKIGKAAYNFVNDDINQLMGSHNQQKPPQTYYQIPNQYGPAQIPNQYGSQNPPLPPRPATSIPSVPGPYNHVLQSPPGAPGYNQPNYGPSSPAAPESAGRYPPTTQHMNQNYHQRQQVMGYIPAVSPPPMSSGSHPSWSHPPAANSFSTTGPYTPPMHSSVPSQPFPPTPANNAPMAPVSPPPASPPAFQPFSPPPNAVHTPPPVSPPTTHPYMKPGVEGNVPPPQSFSHTNGPVSLPDSPLQQPPSIPAPPQHPQHPQHPHTANPAVQSPPAQFPAEQTAFVAELPADVPTTPVELPAELPADLPASKSSTMGDNATANPQNGSVANLTGAPRPVAPSPPMIPSAVITPSEAVQEPKPLHPNSKTSPTPNTYVVQQPGQWQNSTPSVYQYQPSFYSAMAAHENGPSQPNSPPPSQVPHPASPPPTQYMPGPPLQAPSPATFVTPSPPPQQQPQIGHMSSLAQKIQQLNVSSPSFAQSQYLYAATSSVDQKLPQTQAMPHSQAFLPSPYPNGPPPPYMS